MIIIAAYDLAVLHVHIPTLKQTVSAPVATIARRDKREIGDPDRTTKSRRLRSVEEALARERFPCCFIQNVVGFQLTGCAAREIRIYKERALGDIGLCLLAQV